MPWTSVEDFKNTANVHLFTSILLMVFFGVGYHHSRNTHWDGSAPYWLFGAIGGGVHFLNMMCSARVYVKRAVVAEMIRGIGLYRFFLFILLIWSVAGTIATGITGACVDLETCAYQEHQAVNKAMAICILVLHALSFFVCLGISGEVDKFSASQATSTVTQTPQPKPSSSIGRPYPPISTPSRNIEPPPYSRPLPTAYNIPSPPSGPLPPPPSYESIMHGAYPAESIEPTEARTVHGRRPSV